MANYIKNAVFAKYVNILNFQANVCYVNTASLYVGMHVNTIANTVVKLTRLWNQ